jgi:hypothetical protein
VTKKKKKTILGGIGYPMQSSKNVVDKKGNGQYSWCKCDVTKKSQYANKME